MGDEKKKEPYDDPFDHFIKDMIDLLKKMDEDLSRFVNGDISAWNEDLPSGGFDAGYPSSVGDPGGESVEGGGAPLELEEQRVDVIELDEEIIIVADVPGIRKEDISVRVKGREITIRAGDLHKRFQLPIEIDPKRTKATYRNGILEVRISKR